MLHILKLRGHETGVQFQEKVKDANAALDLVQEGLSSDDRLHCKKMLQLVEKYVEECLAKESVDIAQFQGFAK